ncbi:uncharacterized protein [Epargyreus clarus]|uniref:uncharacterized protein isoform X1 n=1 Tax=Epargyreus clarus TaxID=520877 RepID=UPI003C2CE5D0
MRPSFVLLVLTVLACIYYTQACEPGQSQQGCKISGASCTCGYGCKTEFIYKSKRACLSALRGAQTFATACRVSGGFASKLCRSLVTLANVKVPATLAEDARKIKEPSAPSVCHVSGGLISKLCKILFPIVFRGPTLIGREVTGEYYCVGWCTRVIASKISKTN